MACRLGYEVQGHSAAASSFGESSEVIVTVSHSRENGNPESAKEAHSSGSPIKSGMTSAVGQGGFVDLHA
jgi:hypothetical protein